MIRIYYRVSTEKQDFDAQDNGVQKILKDRGIDSKLCTIYQDYAITGTISERKDYQRLMSDIREDDTIIVYEFSRLWRDMEEQSRATKIFLALGIQVLSFSDGDLKDVNDTLSIDIKGVINQYEARRIKQRSRSGIEALQEKCAKGEAVWNGRGPDKMKRSNEGYLKRWQKVRGMKNDLPNGVF